MILHCVSFVFLCFLVEILDLRYFIAISAILDSISSDLCSVLITRSKCV